MQLKIFSVLDTKANAFLPPFFFTTTGQAVRAFKDLSNDPQSFVSRHPGDYRLMFIGFFDDQVGLVTPLETVEPLGYGSDYKDSPDVPVGNAPGTLRSAR